MPIRLAFILAISCGISPAPADARPFGPTDVRLFPVHSGILHIIDRSKAGFRSCKTACERKYYCSGPNGPEKSACISKKQACIAACK